jgi:hypothetical protein
LLAREGRLGALNLKNSISSNMLLVVRYCIILLIDITL